MRNETSVTGLASKYHNRFLFEYARPMLDRCLKRLDVQGYIYWEGTAWRRRRMRVRALYLASLTLNASATWTATLLEQHHGFSMRTQRLFFTKRWRLHPDEWGANAKSCFARALCGHSLGPEGVCVDRHLERLEMAPQSAKEQWEGWFRLYESMYGPGETELCIQWHIDALDWIVGYRGRPEAWK